MSLTRLSSVFAGGGRGKWSPSAGSGSIRSLIFKFKFKLYKNNEQHLKKGHTIHIRAVIVRAHTHIIYIRQRPTLSEIVDDDWRRERFTDLDIILSTKIVQSKLNMDNGDEDA